VNADLFFPPRQQFLELAATHDLTPVCRRLVSDTLTPVSGFFNLDTGGSACLFESVIGGENVGRYSFLAIEPYLELSASGYNVTLRDEDGVREFQNTNPLDELRRHLGGVKVAHLDGLPPFTGGAVGYAGYDVIRYVEELPAAPEDDRQLPDISFAFYNAMVVFDNLTKTFTVVALARTSPGGDNQAAYEQAGQRVNEIVERLTTTRTGLQCSDIATGGGVNLPFDSNFTQPAFEDAVRKCVDYIEAGDIFQVVISQRLAVDIECDPFEIYRTLRVVNPSPFMFFLRTPETTLVGSSPEIMCRVIDGQVTVRPLAGTRPRGHNADADKALAEELLADPKERAEHVMLVDLGRNDVGRVAKYGTVELPEVMVVEKYSHVMHISSTVNGQLRDDCDVFSALLASLPAGTVSGAPKVRAMEIIDEIEPHRRGPYAGAVGYVDFSGNMDTCIALRTIVINNNTAYVQAGAGIVADSVPEMEYQETLNKARGLLKAIEITQQRERRTGSSNP